MSGFSKRTRQAAARIKERADDDDPIVELCDAVLQSGPSDSSASAEARS